MPSQNGAGSQAAGQVVRSRRGSRWAAHLVELGVQGAAELHVLHQVGALALVRGDDADLVRLGARLQQLRGDLLHIGSLRPKKTRLSVPRLPPQARDPGWRLWEARGRLPLRGSPETALPAAPTAGLPVVYRGSHGGWERLPRGLSSICSVQARTLKTRGGHALLVPRCTENEDEEGESLLTCSGRRCLSWRSPLGPGSRRRTSAYQVGATGSQIPSSLGPLSPGREKRQDFPLEKKATAHLD